MSPKKLIVIGVIVAILLLANALAITAWLDDQGMVGWAQSVRAEYVTGTAITVIVTLLILLPAAGVRAVNRWGRAARCPVC